ncbi:MAG: M23 family metallopeptidase [Acidimicrobiia bacterium]
MLLAALIVALVPIAANAGEDSDATSSDPGATPTPVAEPETEPVPETEPQVTAPPAPAPRKIYFTPVRRIDIKKKLVFPVVGVTKYWSGFGDCRDNCYREHFGVDITTYGWKGLPVVAAQDGTVINATFDKGIAGCSLRIRGRDRWVTKYVHLNTDLPGTDQPGETCLAPGIEVGSTVKAGQIIGWIGDSGNAEHGVPNLHFELRTPGGYPVDPYRSLKAARKIEYEWLPSDPSAASVTLMQANQKEQTSVAIVVDSVEASELTRSETSSSVYNMPLFVIDRDNPAAVTAELNRLGIERAVVLSERDSYWMQDVLAPHVQVIETASFPKDGKTPMMMPDAGTMAPTDVNPTDRFATIIAGSVDRLYRSYTTAYEEFIEEHRSIVFASDSRARTSLGERSRSKPGKYVDRNLLWWNTGDGWIGTESIDEVPDFGFAYVTERRATPWTLAFLGSLSEVPAMPLWKSP